jgi:DMSO/TMAO reductase YedYZ molybdopterin-dependent catalytic subunit
MSGEPIISPDTRRQPRLPPGQFQTHQWPETPIGEVPLFDPKRWDLTVFPRPLVSAVAVFTWPEFLALPRVTVYADLHDAAGWSRLGNLWEGVPTRVLRDLLTISPEARFVMAHAEFGVCANMPIEDFFAEDSLFALKHDGRELEPTHGYPVRLVIPRLYAWKSVQWVRGIEFLAEDRPGFLESPSNGGYPMHGDPWATDESGDGQRFRKA